MKEKFIRESGEVSHARIVGAVFLAASLIPLLVWAAVTILHTDHGHEPPLGWKPVVAITGTLAGLGFAVMYGKIQDALDAAIDRLGGEDEG